MLDLVRQECFNVSEFCLAKLTLLVKIAKFAEHLTGAGIEVRNVSDEFGGIALFGPASRELLSRVAAIDASNTSLPFMSVTRTDLALAPGIVARLSVTGELGYEVYVPALYLSALLNAVLAATEGLEARHVGIPVEGFDLLSRQPNERVPMP